MAISRNDKLTLMNRVRTKLLAAIPDDLRKKIEDLQTEAIIDARREILGHITETELSIFTKVSVHLKKRASLPSGDVWGSFTSRISSMAPLAHGGTLTVSHLKEIDLPHGGNEWHACEFINDIVAEHAERTIDVIRPLLKPYFDAYTDMEAAIETAKSVTALGKQYPELVDHIVPSSNKALSTQVRIQPETLAILGK
jgi:hypothetical protein